MVFLYICSSIFSLVEEWRKKSGVVRPDGLFSIGSPRKKRPTLAFVKGVHHIFILVVLE